MKLLIQRTQMLWVILGCENMIDQEKYNQQFASQLIKIEKDLRRLNETMLCLVLQGITLNRLTLKTLQVQFNVMDLKEGEIDAEFAVLMKHVKKYSEVAKEISNTLSLPSPTGED